MDRPGCICRYEERRADGRAQPVCDRFVVEKHFEERNFLDIGSTLNGKLDIGLVHPPGSYMGEHRKQVVPRARYNDN